MEETGRFWDEPNKKAQGGIPLGFGMFAYSLTHRPVDTHPLYHIPGSRTRGLCPTGTLASQGKGKGGFRTALHLPRAGREDHLYIGPSGLTWLHEQLSRQPRASVYERSRAPGLEAPDGERAFRPSSPSSSTAPLDVSAWDSKSDRWRREVFAIGAHPTSSECAHESRRDFPVCQSCGRRASRSESPAAAAYLSHGRRVRAKCTWHVTASSRPRG
jgi:hypothetical protein